MVELMRMMQEIFEALPLKKEDTSDVHNSDHENPCVIDNHNEIHGENQFELVTEDYEDELNIIEMVSKTIDITTDLTVKDMYVPNTLKFNRRGQNRVGVTTRNLRVVTPITSSRTQATQLDVAKKHLCVATK
ncbi:hypothetical protein J1N35_028662 [Gossypium stocksii]|uniref:Uncharacterized protein n=1 Tax=Gossypium stocksii TaxID=47602 RepID=A0A9D3UWG1_9ROSI|nr:hypothetical protein J1N35_028662 [Gossypium stocksii]